jgi:hypothetical protein
VLDWCFKVPHAIDVCFNVKPHLNRRLHGLFINYSKGKYVNASF